MLALLDTATDRRSAIFRSDVRPVWVMSAPKPRRAWRSLPPDRSESGRKFNLLVQVREPLRCPSPPELSSVVGNQRACAEGDGGAEGEGGAVTGVSLRRHRRHAATGGGGSPIPLGVSGRSAWKLRRPQALPPPKKNSDSTPCSGVPIQPVMLSRPRTLPAGFLAPCLPATAPQPPSGAAWLHEIKHDGFRVIACKDGKRMKGCTRLGNDLNLPASRSLSMR
jgi:hypothetical protein